MDKIDEAAVFLSQHCPDSLKSSEYFGSMLSSPESFAAYLCRNPAILVKLRAARVSGNFTAVWRTFDCKVDLFI